MVEQLKPPIKLFEPAGKEPARTSFRYLHTPARATTCSEQASAKERTATRANARASHAIQLGSQDRAPGGHEI